MPPRKSISLSTPRANGRTSLKRSLPISETPASRPNKRRRRGGTLEENDDDDNVNVSLDTDQIQANGDGEVEKIGDLGELGPGLEGEAELEAWQDFAAEHYEMVEQLPLELHRNFRLLRELDDECAGQTQKLQALMRDYITKRIGEPKPSTVEENASAEQKEDPGADHQAETNDTNTVNGEVQVQAQTPIATQELQINVEDADADAVPPRPEVQETVVGPEEMGIPEPDGQGGLLLPADAPSASAASGQGREPAGGQEEGRLPFPQVEMEAPTPTLTQDEDDRQPNGDHEVVEVDTSQPHGDTVTATPTPNETAATAAPPPTEEEHESTIPSAPHPAESSRTAQARAASLLPDIGRLARELVRNGEEKVAVAVGAYNAIDRHIRALDSALSTQEASILLGLRPDTNPSTAVDGTLNGPGDPAALIEDADGEVTIGLGGGGGRRKGKRGKKGRKVDNEKPAEEAALVPAGAAFNIPADPNEPRYCYCHQVSYGEMIGCENEECPLEWFHLPCTGLKSTPAGKWWCENCKPKIGLGMGGAGTVTPRSGPAGHKRKKRPSGAVRR